MMKVKSILLCTVALMILMVVSTSTTAQETGDAVRDLEKLLGMNRSWSQSLFGISPSVDPSVLKKKVVKVMRDPEKAKRFIQLVKQARTPGSTSEFVRNVAGAAEDYREATWRYALKETVKETRRTAENAFYKLPENIGRISKGLTQDAKRKLAKEAIRYTDAQTAKVRGFLYSGTIPGGKGYSGFGISDRDVNIIREGVHPKAGWDQVDEHVKKFRELLNKHAKKFNAGVPLKDYGINVYPDPRVKKVAGPGRLLKADLRTRGSFDMLTSKGNIKRGLDPKYAIDEHYTLIDPMIDVFDDVQGLHAQVRNLPYERGDKLLKVRRAAKYVERMDDALSLGGVRDSKMDKALLRKLASSESDEVPEILAQLRKRGDTIDDVADRLLLQMNKTADDNLKYIAKLRTVDGCMGGGLNKIVRTGVKGVVGTAIVADICYRAVEGYKNNGVRGAANGAALPVTEALALYAGATTFGAGLFLADLGVTGVKIAGQKFIQDIRMDRAEAETAHMLVDGFTKGEFFEAGTFGLKGSLGKLLENKAYRQKFEESVLELVGKSDKQIENWVNSEWENLGQFRDGIDKLGKDDEAIKGRMTADVGRADEQIKKQITTNLVSIKNAVFHEENKASLEDWIDARMKVGNEDFLEKTLDGSLDNLNLADKDREQIKTALIGKRAQLEALFHEAGRELTPDDFREYLDDEEYIGRLAVVQIEPSGTAKRYGMLDEHLDKESDMVKGLEAEAKYVGTTRQIERISGALEKYREENGDYPGSLAEIPKEIREQFLLTEEDLQKDKWGHELEYAYRGSELVPRFPRFRSVGEDGEARWGEGFGEDIVAPAQLRQDEVYASEQVLENEVQRTKSVAARQPEVTQPGGGQEGEVPSEEPEKGKRKRKGAEEAKPPIKETPPLEKEEEPPGPPLSPPSPDSGGEEPPAPPESGEDDERIPWEVESVNDDIKYYTERQAEANRLLTQDKADLERWKDRKSRYLKRENPDPETIKDYAARIKSHEQTIDSLNHDLARYKKRLEELNELKISSLKQAAGERGEDTEEGSGVSTSLDVTGDYSGRLQQKQKQEDITAREDIEGVRKEREVEIQLAIKTIEAWAEVEKQNAKWQEKQNEIAMKMAKAAGEGKDRRYLRRHLTDQLRIAGPAFFGKLGESLDQVVDGIFPSDSAEEVISAPATPTPTATSGLSDITVNTTPITLFIRDYAEEDGDRINIYLNGSIVRRNITITNAEQQVVLMVRLGSNEVAIRALNEGDLKPNTAAIRITGVVKGKKSQKWDLKTGEVGRMRIWYQQR